MTGDEDEAFLRHTQDSTKGKSYCWSSKGTDRGVVEPKLPKKVEKEGSGRTTEGMDQQDGTGRAWRWNLGAGKWVTPRDKISAWQSLGNCLPAGFPPMSRSTSCTSEFEISSRRRVYRKSWPKKVTDGEEIRRR